MTEDLRVAVEAVVTGPLGVDYYRLDDLLSDEERAIRDRVRAFADREVTPVINGYWERAEFPHALIGKLAGVGIAGTVIEGYGCPGMSRMAGAPKGWTPAT